MTDFELSAVTHFRNALYNSHILRSEGAVEGEVGLEGDGAQRCERVCRERVLIRYLIFFRRPINVNRVIRLIFTATTSKGEIKEEKDPERVDFIKLFSEVILSLDVVPERLPILYIVTGAGHPKGILTITQQPLPGEVPSVALPS